VSARCTGEPVSWLRLERYHQGELEAAERARIAGHLAACPACAACLAHIEDDDSRALPPLSLPRPVRRSLFSLFPVRAAAAIGALAAGGALVLGLRGNGHRGELERSMLGESRVKGDAVAFTLVREDGERIAGDAGVYRDGDRFKAVVTCPPGATAAFDVVIHDIVGASFPLEPARVLACGNEVPLPGAFRLTGRDDETVCLVWGEGGPLDRGALAAHTAGDDRTLCKRLTAAPGRETP